MENRDYNEPNRDYSAPEASNPYQSTDYNEYAYQQQYGNQQQGQPQQDYQQYQNTGYNQQQYGYQNTGYNQQQYGYQNNGYNQYGNPGGPMIDEMGRPLKSRFAVQLTFAIIEILLCCFSPVCLVLGIIGLVFAIQANTAYQQGRAYDFKSKSKVANILLIVGGVFAAISIIISVAFVGLNASIYNEMYDIIDEELDEDYYDDYDEDDYSYDEDYDYDEDYEDAYDEDYDSDYEGEYLGDGDIQLVDDFEKFTYNGVAYEVPMSYEELLGMGFVIEEDYQGYIFDSMTFEYVVIYDVNDPEGLSMGTVRISNDTDSSLSVEDCVVDYILFDNNRVYTGDDSIPELDIVYGNGLDINSTYEEIEEYFGTPTYQYIEDGYERYRWYYEGDGFYEEFEVYFMDGEISSIGFDNCIDY